MFRFTVHYARSGSDTEHVRSNVNLRRDFQKRHLMGIFALRPHTSTSPDTTRRKLGELEGKVAELTVNAKYELA